MLNPHLVFTSDKCNDKRINSGVEEILKTIGEWLEIFRLEIDEGYERYRMDRVLARSAEQVDRPPKRLLRFDKPIRAHLVPPGGELSHSIAFRPREVEPKNVGFFCDFDPQQNYMYLSRLGKFLAEREYYWIVKSLLENAGYTLEVETKSELTKSDLQRAREKIRESELFADKVVMPREYVLKFFKEKQLFERNKIPTGYIPEEQRGPYFWGLIDGVSVYSAIFLKDEAVLFDRDEIIVRNTQHLVNFDDIKRPKKLIIEKWCSSAPIIDDAVVKIRL